jgi:hypothetical protein
MKHNMKKPKGMRRGGAGKMPMKMKDGKEVPAFLKKGGSAKKATKKAAAKKKAAPKKAKKKAAKKMSYGGKTKGMARGGKTMGMKYGGKPVFKSRMS